MDDYNNNIIEQREALLDGVNFICSKLEKVHTNQKSSFFIIAQMLVTLALPQNKKHNEINAEDLFSATDLVISALEDVILKSNSKLN